MRIIIVTPLYPPDIAPLAAYTKELARRFTSRATVTVIAYTNLPETLPGVHVVAVPKHIPLPLRLLLMCMLLIKEIHKGDVVFAQNGPSIELPLMIASYITRRPYIFRIADPVGYAYARKHHRSYFIQKHVRQRAHRVIIDPILPHDSISTERATTLNTPDTRPEILPFVPYPTEALEAFEQSWNTHIDALMHIFTNEHNT